MDPITIAMGLAQFAPQVVKWITGNDKASEAAQKVVDIAQVVTGKQGREAIEALHADPVLVMQFNQAVMANEVELDKAYLLDRQNARARDVAFITANRQNIRGDILAVLAVLALVFCVYLVAVNSGITPGAREAIMFVAGVFAGCIRDVYNFEFGSSRSSKEKDSTISNLTK